MSSREALSLATAILVSTTHVLESPVLLCGVSNAKSHSSPLSSQTCFERLYHDPTAIINSRLHYKEKTIIADVDTYKQDTHWPHHSPEKPVQMNKRICANFDYIIH